MLSHNPSPAVHDAASAASSPSRSQHHPNELPRGAGAVDAEEEEEKELPTLSRSSPDNLVAEQQPPLDSAALRADADSSDDCADGELPEYVYVDLREIRKELECPICLGIIKNTRTMMECLHRFCRECIDKSMRMGNNECPACRTHCASRRSLRDDPRHDALIAALFPDIEKYEEEEMSFRDEEKSRNKQIQASIAQTVRRQSEAMPKKRSSKMGTEGSSPSESHINSRGASSRRSSSRRIRKRRKNETNDAEESDYSEDVDNTHGQNSSYLGRHVKEINQSMQKTRKFTGTSCSLSPATSSDGGTEMQTWGKVRVRSNMRHRSTGGNIRKNPRSTGSSKIEFIQNLEEDDKSVAPEIASEAENQLLAADKPCDGSHIQQDMFHLPPSVEDENYPSGVVEDFRDTLPTSEGRKTLPEFGPNCTSHRSPLILACQRETLQ